MGQIDFATFKRSNGGKWSIEVWEIKGKHAPSRDQCERLRQTCRLLEHLFEMRVSFQIKFYKNFAKG